MNLLTAFFLILLNTYPSSPVLFQLFGSNNQISYLIVSFALIFLILFQSNFSIKLPKGGLQQHLTVIYVLLLTVLFASFTTTFRAGVIRDFMLVTCLIGILLFVDERRGVNILRYYVYIMSFLVLVGIVASIPFLFDPNYRLAWHVNDLNLAENNPIILRQNWGDFQYSLPFWFAVIPFHNDMQWTRLPIIFTEPTYFAYHIIAPLAMIVADKRIRFNKFQLWILLTGFFLAMSYVSLMAIPFVILCGISLDLLARFGFKPALILFSGFSILLILAIFPLPFIELLKIIPGGHGVRLLHYADLGYFSFSKHEISLLGLTNDALANIKTYGAGIVIFNYGIIGILAYIMLYSGFLYQAMKLHMSREMNLVARYSTFVGIGSLLIISLKIPQLHQSNCFLLLLYFSYLRRKYAVGTQIDKSENVNKNNN